MQITNELSLVDDPLDPLVSGLPDTSQSKTNLDDLPLPNAMLQLRVAQEYNLCDGQYTISRLSIPEPRRPGRSGM